MAHPQSLKDEVRRLYIFEQQPLINCALTANVAYATAQRWKNQAQAAGDDWDRMRNAHTMAGGELEQIAGQLLTEFVIQFKSTMDIIKEDDELTAKNRVELLTSLSDAYNKAIGANKKLLPQTSKLAVALEVLERLADYIKQNKPELLLEFMQLLEPFGVLIEKELK